MRSTDEENQQLLSSTNSKQHEFTVTSNGGGGGVCGTYIYILGISILVYVALAAWSDSTGASFLKEYKQFVEVLDQPKPTPDKYIPTSSYNVVRKMDEVRRVCRDEYHPEQQYSTMSSIMSQYGRSKGMNYDAEHNLFYCLSAKTGVTHWKGLASCVKHNISFTKLAADYDPNFVYGDVSSLLENSKNMRPDQILPEKPVHGLLVARHPLLRLYSAWSHRLSDSEKYHARFFSKQIKYIKQYLVQESDGKPPKGVFVPFPAFLRFVSLDIAHKGKLRDLHWWRIEKRCHPCNLLDAFDMLANTETASSDAEEVLEILGRSWMGPFPGAYKASDAKGKGRGEIKQTSDVDRHIQDVQSYYRQHVSADVVRGVYKMYEWDFRLFGYTLDGFIE